MANKTKHLITLVVLLFVWKTVAAKDIYAGKILNLLTAQEVIIFHQSYYPISKNS